MALSVPCSSLYRGCSILSTMPPPVSSTLTPSGVRLMRLKLARTTILRTPVPSASILFTAPWLQVKWPKNPAAPFRPLRLTISICWD